MEQPPDSMELKVISCKDLKAFNFFQKLNIYVVASIVYEDDDDDDSSSTPSPTNNNKEKKKKKQQQQKQKTPIDREGDGNPEWNHLMRFDLKDIFSSSSSSSSFLLLRFDLLSEGTILGDKTIGRVRVPFEDLINEFNGGSVRFVSYQVRTTDGIPNGVLDFSFKPIFIHNPPNNTSSSNHHHHHHNHHSSFVEDNNNNNNNNNFGNESATAPPPLLPFGGNTNTNGGGGVGVDGVPLIYRPMPSANNYYPPPLPPLLPVVDDGDDGSYIINPSPAESSYYPKINQFHNPSQEIHYPTLEEIHSPPSEFHNPSSSSQPEVYYPQPQHLQPQVDYHQLPPSSPYHHHHHSHHHHSHHHPLPQAVAYYPPPPPTPPLFYPPGPPPPPTENHHPYGHEFGRVDNPNPVAYCGYPNYWASTQPIHW